MKYILTLITALFVTISPAAGADVETGKTLAQRWCAECHNITENRSSDHAPGWRMIASDPTKTPAKLKQFLLRPHGQMPTIGLTQREIDHLIAYITSLPK